MFNLFNEIANLASGTLAVFGAAVPVAAGAEPLVLGSTLPAPSDAVVWYARLVAAIAAQGNVLAAIERARAAV